jgi:hypothetical protein
MQLQFNQYAGGLHWLYTSSNGETLSIICHPFSYGYANGRFETMCSWRSNVQGHLSFAQVQRKINTIHKRERKTNE